MRVSPSQRKEPKVSSPDEAGRRWEYALLRGQTAIDLLEALESYDDNGWEVVSVIYGATQAQKGILRDVVEGAFVAYLRRRDPGRECPECLEWIWADATRCSHCAVDLIEEETETDED